MALPKWDPVQENQGNHFLMFCSKATKQSPKKVYGFRGTTFQYIKIK